MTPLERLLLEELPTGTFGGTRPTTPPRDLTTEDRATHLRNLAAAISTRHLTPVPAQPQTATTRSAA